jgi:hypothetical protein
MIDVVEVLSVSIRVIETVFGDLWELACTLIAPFP